MSVKQFEEFLTEQLVNAASLHLEIGYRYQFRSPNEENSLKLFQAVMKRSTKSLTSPDGIVLPFIQCQDIKVIPVLHSDNPNNDIGCTENFIVKIRDDVSDAGSWLQGCALIAIHNSNLESLTNNFESLSLPGQIWSSEKIKEAIRGLINIQGSAKDVSLCLLDDQFEMIKDNRNATMFGFESLYNAVADGDLKFNELAMFEDPLITKMEGNTNQIKKRLEENRNLYSEIAFEVEHFGDQLHERLKLFGEKFVNDNFIIKNHWQQLNYQSLLDEKNRNATQHLLLVEEEVNSGATIISRSRAETKSGQRDRHLIIEVDDELNEVEIKLTFQGSNDLDKNHFKLSPKEYSHIKENISTRNGLKNSTATIKVNFQSMPLFFNLALKRENKSEVYNFRCLVIRREVFHIDSFKNSFTLEPLKKTITISTNENKLKISSILEETFELDSLNHIIDNATYGIIDFAKLANESDELTFIVKSGEHHLNFNVEGERSTDSLFLPLLLNRNRAQKVFNDNYNGELNTLKSKVSLENNEFPISAARIRLLKWEEEFIVERKLAVIGDENLTINSIKSIDNDIYNGYLKLFLYLEKHKTTPSLVSWGNEFITITNNIVLAWVNYFSSIQTGTMLTKDQKTMLSVGMIKSGDDEYYSPYHPLIMSYYTSLCHSLTQDNSFLEMSDITFERLVPKGLLPYAYHPKYGFTYTQLVKDNSFWLKSVPHEKSSLTFVRKLVREKISEFQSSYHHLFNGYQKNLIINSVNQEYGGEIFLGIVDYIKKNLEKSSAIHVNIYDDELCFNAFDRFSEAELFDDLKEWLELNKGKVRENADSVIDILRTKLTYSKFTNDQTISNGQAYSHLTFFRNNNKVDCVDVAIDDMASAIACDGFLNGEASESKSGSYFTGFGLKGSDYKDHAHLIIAKYIGSLLQPANKQNTMYHGANAIALAVSEDFKELLKRSYDSSVWTTIIDPKVTLDFFHSNKDVVLIHYSDQYTSSSSYDAITVTAQRGLFETILKQGDGGKLDEFNAFNGDWLLKMLSTDENRAREIKEKKGIIGAYKFVTSLVYGSDITWVPLSVAEMIRVSGNIGLKMSDSDFSRNVNGYSKGEISDDVLLVGLKEQQLVILPVEVKTGATPDYNKAMQQAKELRRYLLEDILGKLTFIGKLHRALFIRQVLMQIDKYRLYNVFPGNYFNKIILEKEVWLKGNYDLSNINEYPEGFVISHLDSASCFEPEYKLINGILRIDLPIGLLRNLVDKPLKELVLSDKIAEICHVPDKFILSPSSTQLLTPFNLGESGIFENYDTHEHCDGILSFTVDDTKNSVLVDTHSDIFQANESKGSEQSLTIQFGNDVLTNTPLNWEPTNTAKFMNTNTGIIGTMGTGKTQFTKSVITQLFRNQCYNVNSSPIGVLIFDYKSDYVDERFLTATSGEKFKLHRLPYNPLSLFGDTPMLPVHTARGFSETMGKAFNLGQKQQLRLRKLIGEAYELAGIHKADPTTWNKPAPTVSEVWDLFIGTEPDEDSLYAALESLYELEIFEDNNLKCQSLYDLVDNITIIELAGYPPEIQNLVVALTLDLFYSQMQKKGKPEVQGDFRQITKMILVDEADNFMSQNFPSLRKILKEGREYGVGMILSTQDITHFQTGENDYSSYVLTWVIHRVAKLKPQDIKAIFSINDKSEQEKVMEAINKLEKHFSIFINGSKDIVKMRDKAFWELVN
ncbi:DNA phosphorothioation-dependent restriction protein DptH [Pantoea sp. C3]|uniref:DNA phosphorothioation-dependent restriction protein DptH n=1 Tax=Pantoea phytostimulans TaxID=2769024 RepID=UPI0038F7F410